MPQPLSRILPNASYAISNSGDKPLFRHPELAVLAMECISTWATVESFLLRLYVDLLGGPNETATAMYLALETQSAKTQSIEAVAQRSLSVENLRLLRAILRVTKTNQKSRDKLAHHVWGDSPNIPDALLLADPKTLVTQESIRDNIYVYRRKDFEQIISANERLCGYCMNFRFIITGHIANSDSELFDRLCSQPEIQEKLDRLV